MHIKTRALLTALITLWAGLFSGCGGSGGGTPPSSDAALASLAIAGVREMIPPAFDPDTTDYTVLVDNAMDTLVITAAARSEASVSGAGELGALPEGETSLELTVTAQNGEAQTIYSLVIVRLDPLGFGPASDPPLLVPGPGEGQLTVQWKAVYGAEAWEVLYDTDDDISGAQTVSLGAEPLSYVIEGIVRGMDYYVWVSAKKGDAAKTLPPASALIPAEFVGFEDLAAFLGSAPQNSAAAPYFVAMSGLTTADLNKVIDGVDISMGALFSALQGRYATVDISALAGPTIPAVSVQATMDRDKLTGVILPDTLEDLGAGVFQSCANLVAVEFGGSLISIGDRAFQSSGLKTLELPDSLQTIGAYAFAGTALKTLELSPGLTGIGGYAFSCPSLMRIDFRAGVSGTVKLNTEGAAFANCTALKTARLPDSLVTLSGSFPNCSALELLSIPATTNSVTVDITKDSKAVRFEARGTGKFETALEGRVLTQLGGTVWITAPGLGGGEITVPEGVIEITERFFADNTELRGITLPSTLTVINKRLFQDCSALERVTINGDIISVGEFAFLDCSALGSISLPESLRYIGSGAFRETGLRSIVVPSKVEDYDSSTGGESQTTPFAYCLALEYADIRTPLLASLMFLGCSELKEIRLTPETKEIAERAFANCVKLEKINPDGLRNINLPPTLETIRSGAFYNCSALAGTLEIPPGVKEIEGQLSKGAGAFSDCTGITELILPRSLGGDFIISFAGCDSIERFGLNGTGELLKVSPEGNLLAKGDAVYWTAKTLGDVTIPAGVRDYTKLTGDISLTGVVFEEDPGLAYIRENAFSGCTKLVRVTLPSGIRAIYNNAFHGCRALEELTITNTSPTALTWPIANTVFRNCVALKTIKVPQALVETYKANRSWQIKPSGVGGVAYCL